MSGDLPDLFPGFDERRIEAGDASIYLRIGGEGPPLLLLHGFPQTHVMWHRLALELGKRFTLVMPDLRGYGQSSIPASDPGYLAYSKRTMAGDMVAVMSALGHERFAVVGHDRGARVGYRMALDHPERVERLAVLDIVPTHAMWHGFTVKVAMKVYHWLFLAQPEPLPEMLISRAPVDFLDYTIASWTKARTLEAFDERALAHYRAFFFDPQRIHAACEDYRAGQTCDLAHDEADVTVGNRIACPVFALWGSAGIPDETDAPLDTWRRWGNNVEGNAIDSGHFIAEENPEATSAALLPFLGRG